MGYYDPMGSLLDDRGFFEFVTPGRVLAEMRSIDSDVGSLARDVAAASVPADYKASFAIFTTEWRAFYDDYTGSPQAWAGRMNNAVIRKVDEYRKTVDGWRAGFEALGGKVTAAKRPSGKEGFPWGWAIGLSGVAALAWYAFRGEAQPAALDTRRKGVRHG